MLRAQKHNILNSPKWSERHQNIKWPPLLDDTSGEPWITNCHEIRFGKMIRFKKVCDQSAGPEVTRFCVLQSNIHVCGGTCDVFRRRWHTVLTKAQHSATVVVEQGSWEVGAECRSDNQDPSPGWGSKSSGTVRRKVFSDTFEHLHFRRS